MTVGLTGGIASGKSVVAQLFKILGAEIFNSDIRAKLQYYKPQIREQVTDLLGKEAYENENRINKAFIASRIFSDTSLLKSLNQIIHPAVANDFKAFVLDHPGKLIIKESALLIETGLYREFQNNILVVSPPALRVKRLQERDGISAEEVQKRFKSQLNDSEKEKHCNFIIRNNEEEFLMPQVIEIFKKLTHV